MIKMFWVARETFVLLMRDGFLWVLGLGFLFGLFFSHFLSSLFLREYEKPFVDSALFFYSLMVALGSLYWGSRVLSGLGPYSPRLCLSVSRLEFYLGSFFGFLLGAFLFFLFSMILIQIFLCFNSFHSFFKILPLFYLETLLFLVLGSLTFFLSRCLSFGFSLGASLFLYLLGLVSRISFEALEEGEVGFISYSVFWFFSNFWDLRIFRISYFDLQEFLSFELLFRLSLQASLLSSLFLFFGFFLFAKEDQY